MKPNSAVKKAVTNIDYIKGLIEINNKNTRERKII